MSRVYKVFVHLTDVYDVEAKDEAEARDKVLSGDLEKDDGMLGGVDVWEK